MESCLFELYLSDNLKDIYEFYDLMTNEEEILNFLKDFPHPNPKNIVEISGDDKVVVVIPTRNLSHRFTDRCRDIFKGLTILFVESGEDRFFSLEHNVNAGLLEAKKLNPDWVIYSNDDMIKIDNSDKLIKELNNKDSSRNMVLIALTDDHGVSIESGIFKTNILTPLVNYQPLSASYRRIYSIRKKFKPRYFIRVLSVNLLSNMLSHHFFDLIFSYTNFCSFGIFSKKMLEECNYRLFDEMYLNWHEDQDVSIKNSGSVSAIDYRIATIGNASFGFGEVGYRC